MAKGDAALGIPVPLSGWMTSAPNYQLPTDALADGLNVVVNRDGLLHVRPGYEPLPYQPDLAFDTQDPRIMGGIAWSEIATENIIVATPTHWWYLTSTGWQNITPDDAWQEGDEPNVSARFAQLGYQDGQVLIYGVNGEGHSLMRKWHLTTDFLPYETVVDVDNGNFTVAANDILVVNNRIVLVGTTEAGVTYPQRVRWSATNNGSSYPPLAFEDLLGDAGLLICGQLSNRVTAIIYAQNGAWIMSAAPGNDADAFTFTRLTGAYAAPWSPAAIVNVGGVHYYLATDRHIWRCDGQSAQPISAAIDAGLVRDVSTDADQAPIALYDASQFRLWFFFETHESEAAGDENEDERNEPIGGVAYDLLAGTWSPPLLFAQSISMAMPVIEQMGPTWDNPGVDANGNTYTWDSAPWASWNAIPETESPAIYVGLANGKVCRFGTAVTDNGTAIPYRAIWGHRMGDDARSMMNVDTVEVYFQPTTEPEPVDVTIQGYQTPYDQSPVVILDREVPQNNINAWLMETDPLPLVPAGSFKNAVFMRFSMAGTSGTGFPVFSGAWVFGNILRRALWV